MTDANSVLTKYGIVLPNRAEGESTTAYARRAAQMVKKKQEHGLRVTWERSAHYARVVAREEKALSFPAMQSTALEDWQFVLIHAATEEQVHGLGANPLTRRQCRMGCRAEENAYHVVAACPTAETTARHDAVVHHIIRTILGATSAPEDIQAQLRPGKALLVAEYGGARGVVRILAGTKICTEPQLYHCRPDIVIITERRVHIFEIAISHLQNIRAQERLKRVRYEKNSTIHVTDANCDQVPRDNNMCEALGKMYRKPVTLGVMVFGAFGEALYTEDMKKSIKQLEDIGVSVRSAKKLIEKCCLEVCTASAKVMMRRLNVRSD